MSADISNKKFKKGKHFISVIEQQGRGHLDSEFNEQIDMLHVRSWIKSSIGQWFSSPRLGTFGGRSQDFMIERIDEASKKVHIRFRGSKYQALPLCYWMFDRAIKHLKDNALNPVPLGSKVQPPYIPNSVEGAIWKTPFPTGKSTYKVSTHICDILALAGLIIYTTARNPRTGRPVQGARLKSSFTKETQQSTPPIISGDEPTEREAFLRKYGSLIKAWVDAHEYELVEARLNYTWRARKLEKSEEVK